MMPWLFAFLLFARIASAGLEQHRELVVADGTRAQPATRDGIRITYLGVNGYEFETGGRALLVDPYFSRISLWAVALNRRIEPDSHRVAQGLAHLHHRVDAVLVTHAHFDHLLDVPRIMHATGARLVAGPTAVNLARSLGVPPAKCQPVQPGSVRRVGPWTIRILAAAHDRVLGPSPPFPGMVTRPGMPPARPADWVLGEPLAFLIEAAGLRIYLDSGGVPNFLPPAEAGPVDLAILGVALRDSRRRFAPAVRRLRPRHVLPSHQDDFFQPLARGFVFGKLTDFPEVRRTFETQRLPGRLILLEYFQPWTLR